MSDGFPTVDVQMVIGLFAIGYGVYGWIGAGVLLIASSVFLAVYHDGDSDE